MNANAVLTKRETQIAELLAWGATKKDVANRLFISEMTVENHTRHIYEKTGVTKINELSAWFFCTKFKISFDMSPLRRSAVALFFLALIVSTEFTKQTDAFVRARTTSIARRARRSET